jgi:hypothetical protein
LNIVTVAAIATCTRKQKALLDTDILSDHVSALMRIPLNKNTISKGLPEHCSTGGGVALHDEAPAGGTQAISRSNSHGLGLEGAEGGALWTTEDEGAESGTCGAVGNGVDCGSSSGWVGARAGAPVVAVVGSDTWGVDATCVGSGTRAGAPVGGGGVGGGGVESGNCGVDGSWNIDGALVGAEVGKIGGRGYPAVKLVNSVALHSTPVDETALSVIKRL